MPYSKPGYRKKPMIKRYAKKKPINRKKIYGAAAGQLWNDVNNLRKLINVEFKSLDQGLNSTVQSTGTFLLCNGCTEGDDFSNRDGRSIRIKSLEYRISWGATASSLNTLCRTIVFVDTQPNGSTPALTDLLLSGAAAGTLAPRNLNNRQRFQIVKDKVRPLNPISLDQHISYYKHYKKLDFHTTYNSSNAGTIADIQTNSLYILLLTDQTGASSPGVSIQIRTRFVDN